MERIIIITVPHGFCLARTANCDVRTCDLRAQEAAQLLYNKLIAKNNYPTLFLSNIERSEHDLNRPWSRDVHWRQELKKTLNKFRNLGDDKIIILVDMHSFVNSIRRPDLHPEETFENKKIGVLDFKKNLITDNLISQLGEKLGQENIVFVAGSEVNDIQLTSREFANYSFLIENNEDSKIYTKQDLNDSMEIIANYLLTFNPPKFKKRETNDCVIL